MARRGEGGEGARRAIAGLITFTAQGEEGEGEDGTSHFQPATR